MKNLITILLLLGTTSNALAISAFQSDGCSSYPDGTLTQPRKWYHCCFVHDIPYWMGGSKQKKKIADKELNKCVSAATNPVHGQMMELGVISGGLPNTGLPWRWGYGFKEMRSFNEMTQIESEEALSKFQTIVDKIEDEHLYLLQKPQRLYIKMHFLSLLGRLSLELNKDSQFIDNEKELFSQLLDVYLML